MKNNFVLIFFLFLSFSLNVFAQEPQDLEVEVESSLQDRAQARSEMFETVIQSTSINLLKDLLGNERFEKNKANLIKKIEKDSNKFILSIRGSDLVKTSNGFKMKVSLKFSKENLRDLLYQEGFMSDMNNESTKVLIAVQFFDRVHNLQAKWWSSNEASQKNFVAMASRLLFQKANSYLKFKNFEILKNSDQSMIKKWPHSVSGEEFSLEQVKYLAEVYKVNLVLVGSYEFNSSSNSLGKQIIKVNLKLINPTTERILSTSNQVVETEAGPFEAVVNLKLNELMNEYFSDLSIQINDMIKYGSINARVYQMSVKGSFDPIKEALKLEAFKNRLPLENREIKTIKERSLSSKEVVYEIESTVSASALMQILNSKNPPYKISIE